MVRRVARRVVSPAVALLVVLGLGPAGCRSCGGDPAPASGATSACRPGQALEQGRCVDVAVTLHGLRWEMPCGPGGRAAACNAADPRPTRSARLGGTPGRLYDVTLRFRGVVEQMAYRGGTQEELWYVGGSPANGSYNVYELRISRPEQVFYLNAGTSGVQRCFAIDYTRVVRVAGGATVTLTADAQDGRLIVNRDESGAPIVVPGIAPAPQPFDGQLIQADVLSVTPHGP